MRYLLLLGLAAFSAVSAEKKDPPCVCPLIWKPVCGSDGQTYPSECILNCVKYALKKDIKVAYQGICKHVTFAAEEEQEVEGWKDPCECPRALHRVCGSDGNTYSNPCTLNCAKHERKSDLVQVHEGPCSPDEHDFEDPCECDNKFDPVCGTDEVTYRNLCHLECATFTTSPGVEVDYEGECLAETVLLEENDCACPRVLHRVCGSDGNTYSNPCTLDCAKHEGKPDLVQVHEGPCDPNDHDFEDPCECDNKFEPVCGTDEVTYSNLCHLECAAFTTSPGVEVKYEGECHAEIMEQHQILKSCICTKIYSPVCGTDGHTYSNLCVLKCRISSKPGLKLAHVGKCGIGLLAVETKEVRNPCACFRNYVPVCGSDGKTYGNPCMLNCAAQTKVPGLKLVHKGRCQRSNVEQVAEDMKQDITEFIRNPCLCPKIWQPVCGTDGRTYANECT